MIVKALTVLFCIIAFVSTAIAAVPLFEIDMDPDMPGIQNNIDSPPGDTFVTDVVITLPDNSATLSSFGFSVRWDNAELVTPVLSNVTTYPLASGWIDLQCWEVDSDDSLIVNCSQINYSDHAEGSLSQVVAKITWTTSTPIADSMPDIEAGFFHLLDIAYDKNSASVTPTFLGGTIGCDLDPVRISRLTPFYSESLQTAYSNAATNETIQSQNGLINENIEFGRDIVIRIEAGRSCDYASASGTTTITGDMLISDGAVTILSGTLELQL